MKEEMRVMEKSTTRELVNTPARRKVTGVKWICKTKLNEDGSIKKCKLRRVAEGFV